MTARNVDEFALSTAELWGRPQSERHRPTAELRQSPGLPLYPEPPVPGLPPGRGFYAVTRHADVAVSRDPQAWCSGGGAFTIQDLPPQLLECLGSMIVMDDSGYRPVLRSIGAAASGVSSRSGAARLPRLHEAPRV